MYRWWCLFCIPRLVQPNCKTQPSPLQTEHFTTHGWCNQSPWYNCTGWLGIKHKFTYLLVQPNCKTKPGPPQTRLFTTHSWCNQTAKRSLAHLRQNIWPPMAGATKLQNTAWPTSDKTFYHPWLVQPNCKIQPDPPQIKHFTTHGWCNQTAKRSLAHLRQNILPPMAGATKLQNTAWPTSDKTFYHHGWCNQTAKRSLAHLRQKCYRGVQTTRPSHPGCGFLPWCRSCQGGRRGMPPKLQWDSFLLPGPIHHCLLLAYPLLQIFCVFSSTPTIPTPPILAWHKIILWFLSCRQACSSTPPST